MGVKRYPEDKAFSDSVREAYDYTCLKCRKNYRHQPGYIDCAHIHTRSHRSTRWNATYGAVALCKPCHRRFTSFPLEWGDFLRREFGDAWYDEAKRLAWETRKYTPEERREIKAHYKAEKERIEALRREGVQGVIELVSYH